MTEAEAFEALEVNFRRLTELDGRLALVEACLEKEGNALLEALKKRKP